MDGKYGPSRRRLFLKQYSRSIPTCPAKRCHANINQSQQSAMFRRNLDNKAISTQETILWRTKELRGNYYN